MIGVLMFVSKVKVLNFLFDSQSSKPRGTHIELK